MTITSSRLVSLKKMLPDAIAGNYAVGHFNINNFKWIEAILEAAEKEQSPVIVASSDRIVDYLGGFETIVMMVNRVIVDKNITVPVALHLDHSTSVERCKQAIDAGYTSVMIDGSRLPLEQNIAVTKEVVEYARKYDVSVEGEVGSVGGIEDGMVTEVAGMPIRRIVYVLCKKPVWMHLQLRLVRYTGRIKAIRS